MGMSIPVLPHGPLSVRQFSLETAAAAEGPWSRHSDHSYTTLDLPGLQQFGVDPAIEAHFVRLVCTENAVGLARTPTLGLWQFELSSVKLREPAG